MGTRVKEQITEFTEEKRDHREGLHRGAGSGRQMSMDNSAHEVKAGKVWFITGASTGFGRLLAEEVLKGGGRVLATARKPEQITDLERQYPKTARTFTLDVTRPTLIEAVAQRAVGAFGRVDVLVNNAGYGIAGGIEEASEAEFLPVFETNVFGLMRVTRAFLPQFRKQRSGHIINMSSMAGIGGSAGWGYYNASKFAVEGFSEALAGEMAAIGVKVTAIEPGPFRTDFLGRSGVVAKRQIEEYKPALDPVRTYFHANNGKQRGDPAKAIQAILDVAESPNPPLHLLLGHAAYNRMKGKLEQWREEMAKYEGVTLGADFPEGQ
jgi:NAD(P)-dependent dehydrogenase (short-subunit alcohol dehydrogenase family)